MRILGIVALGAALGGCASSAAPATGGGMVTNSFSVPNCFPVTVQSILTFFGFRSGTMEERRANPRHALSKPEQLSSTAAASIARFAIYLPTGQR
jgi:hypothetical protein